MRAPDKGKTKVVEMGGEPISKGVFKGDPFKQKGCPYDRKCAVGNKAVCTQQRTIYQLVCLICKEEGGEDRRDGNRLL